MAYVRTVKTASGATAVQIVHGTRRGARRMEHVGSAHDEQELQALKTAAAQRLALLYPQLDLDLDSEFRREDLSVRLLRILAGTERIAPGIQVGSTRPRGDDRGAQPAGGPRRCPGR